MAYAWRVIDKGYTKLKAELLKLEGRSTVYVGVQGAAANEIHEEEKNVSETSLEPTGRTLGFRAIATKLRRGKPVSTVIEPIREDVLVTKMSKKMGAHRKVTNAQVATWMEYGTPTIPSRPAFRMTIEQNAVKYYKFIKSGLVAVVERRLKDTHLLLSLLGERAVADVRLTIRKGVPPPLSADRIKRKKSSKPLIDTGQLINSITYEVESRP